MFACAATDDFFRSRIDHMIDLRHRSAVLASRMFRQEIEARVAQAFSGNGHAGVAIPELDLFGEQMQRAPVVSNAGRSRVPLLIMIALLYLKHAFNESYEGVVAHWVEKPRWQFFSGCAYYEDRQPCASTLVKFRQLLGEEGVEELLAQTINVAAELKLIKPQEHSRVIVDSTVQHKAIAHPTDSRLLETARAKLVQAAKVAGITLKQTNAKEGVQLNRKAGRYAHARQFKRMERGSNASAPSWGDCSAKSAAKMAALSQALQESLAHTLDRANA
jgi:IS5 family transposase